MKVRSDIAEMLRDGLTDKQIARHARVGHKTAATARAALGIPKCIPGGKHQPSLEHALRSRSVQLADGHWEWTGPRHRGLPLVGFAGRRYTAARAAFVVRWGRAPFGEVRRGCDHDGCVAPDHMEDRPMRDHNSRTFNAIFGGVL